jgi:hypothetical protein
MHPEPHDLTALAYGLVEGDERDRILEHLASCDRCRDVYDSYRDEQAFVRDAVIADARSGPAEARALERTLVMLGAADSVQAPRGRMIRLPVWVWLSQAAALIAIAVGLFFIMSPEPQPRLVPVPVAMRAAAHVEQGKLLVSASDGQWREAEAVPVDEWVKAADRTSLKLDDGSRVELSNNAIVRLSRDGDALRSVLLVLCGSGTVTANGGQQVMVRGGETGLYALPGASLSFECAKPREEWLAQPQLIRTWHQPEQVTARIVKGDAVLKSGQKRFASLPLQLGETVMWTRERIEAHDAQGQPLPVEWPTYTYAFAFDGERTADIVQSIPMLDVLLSRTEGIRYEYGEAFSLIDEIPVHIQALRASQGDGSMRIGLRSLRRVAGREIHATDGPEGVDFFVDGKLYKAKTPEELRRQVPAEFHELLDLYTFELISGAWKVREDKRAFELYVKKHAADQPAKPGEDSEPARAVVKPSGSKSSR